MSPKKTMNNKVKPRLLIWSDMSLLLFFITHFLQKNFDSDLFVIYDILPIQKNFFQNQNIVNFKKFWFYRDQVSTVKKPDLKYLKLLEEKNNLNLWKMPFNDPNFLRNHYHKFERDEILSILEQEFRFFEKVLDEIKPDFFLSYTTESRSYRLSELCKGRGIKVLMLNTTRMIGRTTITHELNILSDFEKSFTNTTAEKTNFEDLRNYLTKYHAYNSRKSLQSGGTNLSISGKIDAGLLFLKTYDDSYKNFYTNYGRTRFNIIKTTLLLSLKTWYRQRFIDKNFISRLPENEKFVYFPLHLQPERGVDVAAPFYSNQPELIISIVKSLPVGYKLYVKEHWVQRYNHWRSLDYYKQILELPNVVLIHPSVNPIEILKKCSLVITIAGTAGLEAVFYHKPSIVFADVCYDKLPSVDRVKSFEDLPRIIRQAINKKVDYNELNEFIDLVDENTIEFDITGLYNDLFRRFYYNNLLADNKISSKEVNSFFDDNQKEFEKLALEHLKKIKQAI